MAKKYLRKKQVAERYGCCERQVDLMAKDGRLPKPIYVSKFPLWDEETLAKRERAALAKVELGIAS